jgi:hypothetical protein
VLRRHVCVCAGEKRGTPFKRGDGSRTSCSILLNIRSEAGGTGSIGINLRNGQT